jgi:predicted AAA+ superfamily ATPase
MQEVQIMKRYAINGLVEWKNSASRKPLLVYGARQVGKTWLVRAIFWNLC